MKSHVGEILRKLQVRDRVQVVVLAYESGLVAPGFSADVAARQASLGHADVPGVVLVAGVIGVCGVFGWVVW